MRIFITLVLLILAGINAGLAHDLAARGVRIEWIQLFAVPIIFVLAPALLGWLIRDEWPDSRQKLTDAVVNLEELADRVVASREAVVTRTEPETDCDHAINGPGAAKHRPGWDIRAFIPEPNFCVDCGTRLAPENRLLLALHSCDHTAGGRIGGHALIEKPNFCPDCGACLKDRH
jgi:hypothetical protein